MPAKSLKAADKQTILKKLVTEMKRRYGGSVPKQNRSAFDTLLFAICLEDVSQSEAEAAYTSLLEPFFDLNEIRVSSVTQIEEALGGLRDADWKALRIREALQHVFEKLYAFDLEYLRRKTQEQAIKELSQIPYLTPFARNYTIQHVLGAHVLPIDRSMASLLIWLGLAEPGSDVDIAAEEVKAGVKKADGVLLCHLLKAVSTDPELREHFEEGPGEDEELDPFSAPQRLADLFKNPARKKKKAKPASKAVSRKKPAKKTGPRTSAKKSKTSSKKKITKKVPTTSKKTSSSKRSKS